MMAIIGGCLMIGVPVLIGAIFGFDAHRNFFFSAEKLGIALLVAAAVFVIGAVMYAPVGMAMEGFSFLRYFIWVLLYGMIAFVLCAIAWRVLFWIIGLGIALYRRRSVR